MFDFEGQYKIINDIFNKLIEEGQDLNDFFSGKMKFTRALIIAALSSENTEALKAIKLLNFKEYTKDFIIPEEIFNNIIKKENRVEYFSEINELGLFNNDYTKSIQDVFSYVINNNQQELVDDLLEADVQPFFSGKKNYLLAMIKNKDITNFKKYMEKDFYVNMEDIKDIFMEVDINSKEDVNILTDMLQLISSNSYLDKKEEIFLASKLFTNMLKTMDLETLKSFDKIYPINEFNMIKNYSYFKNNSDICNSLSKNECEILLFLKEISSMKYILSILTNEIFVAALNNNIERNKYFLIGTEVEFKDFINKKAHDLLPDLIKEDKLNSIDFLLDMYTDSKSEILTAPDFDIQSHNTEFSKLIDKNIDNIIEKIWLDKESQYYNILDKYILNTKNISKESNFINKMYIVKGNENKGIQHDIISLPLLAVYMNNNEMAKKIINYPNFDLPEQFIVLSRHRSNNEAIETVFNNFVSYDINNKLNIEEMKDLLQKIKEIPERDLSIRYDYSVNYIQTLSEKRELHDLITPNILNNKEKNRL